MPCPSPLCVSLSELRQEAAGQDAGAHVHGCASEPADTRGCATRRSPTRFQVFGPVLACTTFVTEEEALRLANDSEFGLGAAVISADEEVRAAFQPRGCRALYAPRVRWHCRPWWPSLWAPDDARHEHWSMCTHSAGEPDARAAVLLQRCRRVSAALEAGVTWINCAQPCFCQVCGWPPSAEALACDELSSVNTSWTLFG